MKQVKYAILGAGPSGLSLAHALLKLGCKPDQLLILEKENDPGGLCRSILVDNAPLDIGGGHFLDLKNKKALDFLFTFMPQDEWNIYERISKIRIQDWEIDHPFEANLWQFPANIQADFLESIAKAGCVQGKPFPNIFSQWIKWKFGEKIANDYMLPYNQKIWSMNLDELGTYWLHKLPNVSFRETLESCLEKKTKGTLPAHAKFLYPKNFGYGEIWLRMGNLLGDSLLTNFKVLKIDPDNLIINDYWQAKTIINTIPWTLWPKFCDLPKEIEYSISKLKSVGINIEYHSETLKTNSHWTYVPDDTISYHRLLIRSNFIKGSQGYWTETNPSRSIKSNGIHFDNEYAYPINTIEKPELINKIIGWGIEKKIIGLGRWGLWEHMNSDIAVNEAIQLAHHLALEDSL